MKMRKLFAGIAAAATLLGGMTLTASAYADGGDATEQPSTDAKTCSLELGNTITLNAKDGDLNTLLQSASENRLRDYQYVKIANLSESTDSTGDLLDIKTTDAAKSFVTKALDGTDYDSKTYKLDPMRWVIEHMNDADFNLRNFVNALAQDTNDSVSPKLTLTTPAEGKLVLDATNKKATLTLDGQDEGAGVYLIIDKSGEQTFGSSIYQPSVPMLLSTEITATNCTINGGSGEVNVKPDKETVGKHDFTFKKVDAANTSEGVAGATFQVYESTDTKHEHPLNFTVNDDNSEYTLVDTAIGGTATNVITTPDSGSVTLKGLRDDKSYVVVETKVAPGYLDYKADFTLTWDEDKNSWTMGDANDTWDLIDTQDHLVKNVKRITDLPNTGAAGTILFTVVGVLLAGAAATVFARSRSTKRQLMA